MAPGKESRFCPRARLNPPLMAEYHHSYRVPGRELFPSAPSTSPTQGDEDDPWEIFP